MTYAHAGHGDAYHVGSVNDTLCQAATRIQEVSGTAEDAATQRAVVADNPLVLGTGNKDLKQPPAGLIWLDFSYLPGDSPPQVVGHTRHDRVTQQGRVVCENVIRNSEGSTGGEAVVVETPSRLVSLTRQADGSVRRATYDV